jgi:hypothetical protein
MTEELKTVIEMMLGRLADRPGAAFSIPSDIVSPETVTDSEAQALEAAGFVWTEGEQYRGYMLEFNR